MKSVSAPPDSSPGVEIQFFPCCSVSFLHFPTPEKYRFVFLSWSDLSNRKHSNIFRYIRPSATETTSYWRSHHVRLSQTKPANGNDSAWWHKFSPQMCALATQSSENGALQRRADALGGAAAPSLVATCLIVVYVYFGVQFRSWTYSLIGIKRLVTVTLIEGRI